MRVDSGLSHEQRVEVVVDIKIIEAARRMTEPKQLAPRRARAKF